MRKGAALSFSRIPSEAGRRVARLACRTSLALLTLSGCEDILGIDPGMPRPHDEQGGAAGDAGQGGTSGETPTESGAGQGGIQVEAGAGGGGSPTLPVDGGMGGALGGSSPSAGSGGDAISVGGDGPGGAPPGDCREGTVSCDGNVPQKCEAGAWSSLTLCSAYCLAGECQNPPSCDALEKCGNGEPCCRALEVPGGTFIRDYDGVDFTDETFTAKLSPFLLDKFEVTVGRFRNFVNAYPSIDLTEGQGKADHIESDPGWRESYPMPATQDALRALLGGTGCTWTGDGSGNENLPMNCVSFFLAYAFCIWDGGRLPTEAEWNFAAAGGDEQRVYPWSQPPGDTSISPEQASFYPDFDSPPPVGSKVGNGRWGQADLAGGAYEWTLDYYVETYPSTLCEDCLVTSGDGQRAVRGGAFNFFPDDLRTAVRGDVAESAVHDFMGFRCARDIPPPP
jgi:formylglycine-generating enzyme